jgi:MFS family permease
MSGGSPTRTGYLGFAYRNRRMLGFGFLMAFGSSFGQTYFIGVFSPSIETAFSLSHTEWGSIYMIGTLASAVLLPFSGRLIDRMPVRTYAIIVAVGMVVACLAMSLAPVAWTLIVMIFLLRQFGQGLCQHTAVTGMVKFFERDRGKAVAIAILGFPAGRAFLPVLAVAVIGAVGWRWTYAICAVAGLLMIPVIIWLLPRRHDTPDQAEISELGGSAPVLDRRLGHMLRDPFFFLMLPALMAPALLETAMNFHQLTIADMKGWSAEWVTAGYAVFALTTVMFSMYAGDLADRIGAVRLMPFALVPLAVGVLVVGYFDHFIWAWVYLGCFGITSGLMVTCVPLLLADVYGTRHIGAIRSFATTVSVIGSALAPPLLGLGLDAEVSLAGMGVVGAVYVVLASILMTCACRREGAK